MAHGDNQSLPVGVRPRSAGVEKALRDAEQSTAGLKYISGFSAVSDVLKSPYLHETLNRYSGLCAGSGTLPPPSSFDPTALPTHLVNMYRVEIYPAADGGQDYRYSMFGTGLTLIFGVNMVGKSLHAYPDRSRADRTAQVFRHVAETGLLTRTMGQFQTRNGMPMTGEALLMPYGEMGTVTHIIADLDYDIG